MNAREAIEFATVRMATINAERDHGEGIASVEVIAETDPYILCRLRYWYRTHEAVITVPIEILDSDEVREELEGLCEEVRRLAGLAYSAVSCYQTSFS